MGQPQTELGRAQAELEEAARDGAAVVLACVPSLEGVLSSVGLAYLAHLDTDAVRLCPAEHCQPQLGERVVMAPSPQSDEVVVLARRVYAGLERAVSGGCARRSGTRCPSSCVGACVRKLVYACATDREGMPQSVYRYARLAFAQKRAVRHLSAHPDVVAIDELARYALNECEKTRQFVRFSRLSDDTFLAVFRPQANTVPLTQRHFADRLRGDRFCIVDPVHLVAAFHEKGRVHCRVVALDEQTARQLASREDLAEDERYVQELWRCFYRALELPGRDASMRGYDLRMKWMPKRFWDGLPEMAGG